MSRPDAPAGAAGTVRVPGVREPLPEGERVLWEGSPRPGLLARHVLHVRLVAAYFAVTVGWWLVRVRPTLSAAEAAPMLVGQLVLALLVLALVVGYAALVARSASYVVTSRRVVLRVGAVFPVVVNVPLAQVVSAGVHRFRDGSAQIALQLERGVRASWWLLWPHARTSRLRWPEPLLRALTADDAAAAAAALQTAVAALDAQEARAEPAASAHAEHVTPVRPAEPPARAVAAGTPLAAA